MDDRRYDEEQDRSESWKPPVYGQGSYGNYEPKRRENPDTRDDANADSGHDDEPLRRRQHEPYDWRSQGGPSGPSGPSRPDGPDDRWRERDPRRDEPKPYQPAPTKTSPLVVLVAVLLTFILTASIFIGFIWSNLEIFPLPTQPTTPQDTEAPSQSDDDLIGINDDKLQEMIQILRDNYYRELSDEEILEAMITGLPEGIESPYTYYLTEEQFAAMQESIQGEYSGIGATVQMVTDGVYEIVEPTEDSPAKEVGLQPGDRFVSVDGKEVGDFPTVTDLATAVKGEIGTTVELVMYRPSTDETLTFVIERRPIISHPVSYRMQEDDLGYMQIREFSLNLPEEFQLGMRDMLSQGAKSIVFDLRNNPGGAADSAIKVLDYLLPEGTIATIKGRSEGQDTDYSWTSDESMFVPEDMTFIILVNRNSASASELFTGALRDWDKAYIIGEQTYGKGSGTVAYRLEDGSALNVTVFNYYLPNGDLIEGEGIPPDEEVSLSPEASTKLISELTLEEDTQLQAALDYWHSIR